MGDDCSTPEQQAPACEAHIKKGAVNERNYHFGLEEHFVILTHTSYDHSSVGPSSARTHSLFPRKANLNETQGTANLQQMCNQQWSVK